MDQKKESPRQGRRYKRIDERRERIEPIKPSRSCFCLARWRIALAEIAYSTTGASIIMNDISTHHHEQEQDNRSPLHPLENDRGNSCQFCAHHIHSVQAKQHASAPSLEVLLVSLGGRGSRGVVLRNRQIQLELSREIVL